MELFYHADSDATIQTQYVPFQTPCIYDNIKWCRYLGINATSKIQFPEVTFAS